MDPATQFDLSASYNDELGRMTGAGNSFFKDDDGSYVIRSREKELFRGDLKGALKVYNDVLSDWRRNLKYFEEDKVFTLDN